MKFFYKYKPSFEINEPAPSLSIQKTSVNLKKHIVLKLVIADHTMHCMLNKEEKLANGHDLIMKRVKDIRGSKSITDTGQYLRY